MVAEFEAILRFLERGGDILYIILVLSVLMLTLIIERYWFLKIEFPKQSQKIFDEWNQIENHKNWQAQRIKEGFLSEVKNSLESMLGVVKALVALAPLLGLLGTVTGMIQVFDVMTMIGTSNARAMASGVSMATIPTMAGMVIAVVGIFLVARFEQAKNIAMNRFIDQL